MIAEVIIAVANSDIEGYASIELTQVFLHMATVLENEIDNI